jgi:hypothetical protein
MLRDQSWSRAPAKGSPAVRLKNRTARMLLCPAARVFKTDQIAVLSASRIAFPRRRVTAARLHLSEHYRLPRTMPDRTGAGRTPKRLRCPEPDAGLLNRHLENRLTGCSHTFIGVALIAINFPIFVCASAGPALPSSNRLDDGRLEPPEPGETRGQLMRCVGITPVRQ